MTNLGRGRRQLRRRVLAIAGALFAVFIAAFFYCNVHTDVETIVPRSDPRVDETPLREVMVFGASGTVGGGIYKALLEDDSVQKIHVVSLENTPHIQQGVDRGKVVFTHHTDYLDYAPIRDQLRSVQAIYWAIGISAPKVDKETYEKLHIDFPVAFVEFWLALDRQQERSFHLITGAGTSSRSWFHWARTKAEVQRRLRDLAEGTGLRVVTYRPIAVVPTQEGIAAGKKAPGALATGVFGAIEATHIGQGMIEVTARGGEIGHGAILENDSIELFARAYRERLGTGR